MLKIPIERAFNPTLCGFDPLATTSHKGDGRYCFELYPMTQEEFAQEFGKDVLRHSTLPVQSKDSIGHIKTQMKR